MEENKKTNIKKWIDEKIVAPGDEFSPSQQDLTRRIHITTTILFFLFTAIGIAIYVSISFGQNQYWSSMWVLCLLGIIISSLVKSLLHGRMTEFAYPILIVAFYCSIGDIYQIWHPLWVLFLTIPIYYFIGYFIDRIKRKD